MNLLIDVGNTRIKWAAAEGRVLRQVARAPRRAGRLAAQLTEQWPGAPPTRILASNVAGEAGARLLAEAVRRLWDLEPELQSTPASGHGIRCAYREPWRMGVDRWAAIVGAVHGLNAPADRNLVVVDCGTAVTVDAVAGGRQHLGGLILPGRVMMQRSLLDETSGIATASRGADGAARGVLGRDTRSAVEHGALNAIAGTVERVVRWLADQRRTQVDMVVTGGDGPLIAEWLPAGHRQEPDLVLKGLAVMGEDRA